MREKVVFHYWIGNLTGHIFSTEKKVPISKSIDRLKYMGFTSDISWPKKMNTGRLLHRPFQRAERKREKRHKNALKKLS